jgi:hypothetical protein
MKNYRHIPVRYIATTPSGDVPLNADGARKYLPIYPQAEDAENGLRYGPYLEAVCRLLLRKNCQMILEALARRLNRVVGLAEIEWLEVRTEKHGAWYNVARADFSVVGDVKSFAVNVAVSAEAKAQLVKDFRLLKNMARRYRYPYLPRVYFRGAERYREDGKTKRWLHMFVAEWLMDYHEFHLHLDRANGCYRLLLWDLDRGSRYLSQAQCTELYRQMARILTVYYDWNAFSQIYPWHHAAGDFVLKEDGERVDVRLVTIRDYGPVVNFTTGKRAGKLLALILFFLHLTVQMRFDRLDGVGKVVWADDYCLEGVVAGFFEGLALGRNAKERRGIPPTEEIRALFRSFAQDEWLQFMQEYLDTYDLSQEELSLTQAHSDTHLSRLQQVLATSGKKFDSLPL